MVQAASSSGTSAHGSGKLAWSSSKVILGFAVAGVILGSALVAAKSGSATGS
jgi:hypothetical protein